MWFARFISKFIDFTFLPFKIQNVVTNRTIVVNVRLFSSKLVTLDDWEEIDFKRKERRKTKKASGRSGHSERPAGGPGWLIADKEAGVEDEVNGELTAGSSWRSARDSHYSNRKVHVCAINL